MSAKKHSEATDVAATLDARVSADYRSTLTPDEVAASPNTVTLYIVTARAVVVPTSATGDGTVYEVLEQGAVLPELVPAETVTHLTRKHMVRPVHVTVKENR